MSVRVRYAPSPTGLQHIGSVRTALFNYLFARSRGGKFILRIEDTDRTRTTPEAVQNLYDTFAWLGVKWDEGPDVGGPHAPYVQSERFELFKERAQELVAKDSAYYCFCDSERLDRIRKEREESKSSQTGYDRHCRSIPADEAARRAAAGEPHVIRLKIPSGGMTKIHDRLLGDIEWKNDDVSPDPVLLKSDGFPTYHLANVVDDHLMEITHVLRAQEWLPSTPLHVIMYAAFGWQPPEFCHLPLVMGQDGHKLSKRHGSTSVDEFRDSGYLPQALLNYVGMLGASYEDGRDIYPLADMERLFSLDKLNKAPAVFDYKKLEWFNGQYIRMKSDEELSAMILPFAVKAGLFGKEEAAPDEAQKKLFVAAMGLVKERLSFLKDAPPMMAFLFSDPILPQAEDFIPKKLDAAKTVEILSAMERFFTDVLGKSDETIEELFRAQAERLEVKLGDLLMPVRVALTGTKVSPPLLGGIRLLGEAKTRERIKKAIERIKG